MTIDIDLMCRIYISLISCIGIWSYVAHLLVSTISIHSSKHQCGHCWKTSPFRKFPKQPYVTYNSAIATVAWQLTIPNTDIVVQCLVSCYFQHTRGPLYLRELVEI